MLALFITSLEVAWTCFIIIIIIIDINNETAMIFQCNDLGISIICCSLCFLNKLTLVLVICIAIVSSSNF